MEGMEFITYVTNGLLLTICLLLATGKSKERSWLSYLGVLICWVVTLGLMDWRRTGIVEPLNTIILHWLMTLPVYVFVVRKYILAAVYTFLGIMIMIIFETLSMVFVVVVTSNVPTLNFMTSDYAVIIMSCFIMITASIVVGLIFPIRRKIHMVKENKWLFMVICQSSLFILYVAKYYTYGGENMFLGAALLMLQFGFGSFVVIRLSKLLLENKMMNRYKNLVSSTEPILNDIESKHSVIEKKLERLIKNTSDSHLKESLESIKVDLNQEHYILDIDIKPVGVMLYSQNLYAKEGSIDFKVNYNTNLKAFKLKDFEQVTVIEMMLGYAYDALEHRSMVGKQIVVSIESDDKYRWIMVSYNIEDTHPAADLAIERIVKMYDGQYQVLGDEIWTRIQVRFPK